MPTIVFICTANRYRSPLAEACFKSQLDKHSLDDNWEVLSAGTWTEDGLPAMSEAIKDAQRYDLDYSIPCIQSYHKGIGGGFKSGSGDGAGTKRSFAAGVFSAT